MNSKEKQMNNKDQIGIEYDGIRYVFKTNTPHNCFGCVLSRNGNPCHESYPAFLYYFCKDGCYNSLTCTSATKIEDEAKIYHAANKDEARRFEEMHIEYFHGNAGWTRGRLKQVRSTCTRPFSIYKEGDYSVIREIKPETITLSEARERFIGPKRRYNRVR